jgi:SAM-dependent methyltransferase
MGLRSRLFRWIVAKEPTPTDRHDDDLERDELSMRRFFDRFGSTLELSGKSVLDIGCGTGAVCIEAARRGAARVVGVDMQLIDVASDYLVNRHPDLVARTAFVKTDGTLREIAGQTFDVILSKDSFEHYADPEGFVHVMTTFLAPGGVLAMGFGPLWKSPFGGHIDFMTRLPWAHLIFPEQVIMSERRRFRPAEDARHFEEIVGGLNKITYRRFENIMRASGLECRFLDTNVSFHPAMKAMKLVSRVPLLREYFTNNVYTVWFKPFSPDDSTHATA